MTRSDKAMLKREVKRLTRLFDLESWQIVVEFSKRADLRELGERSSDNPVMGYVDFDVIERVAKITVSEIGEVQEVQSRLRHEFLHLMLAPLDSWVRTMLLSQNKAMVCGAEHTLDYHIEAVAAVMEKAMGAG